MVLFFLLKNNIYNYLDINSGLFIDLTQFSSRKYYSFLNFTLMYNGLFFKKQTYPTKFYLFILSFSAIIEFAKYVSLLK